MSFRPQGRARTNPSQPQAWAICDRCGFTYNHIDLTWQFDWQGPRLQNLRKLVCRSCLDLPFDHHRTIILPPDPVPIANPRPEFYTAEDNPDSIPGPNWDPLQLVNFGGSSLVTQNGNIGNLYMGGGVDAAFVGFGTTSNFRIPSSVAQPAGAQAMGQSKRAGLSALRIPSVNGLNNYVGQNWSAQPGTPPASLAVQTPSNNLSSNSYGTTLQLASFTIHAPADQPFLAGSSGIAIELDGWTGATWTPLWSGTTVGSQAETFSVTLASTAQGAYYGHRVVLNGDGTHAIAVARLTLVGLAEMAISSAGAPTTQAS